MMSQDSDKLTKISAIVLAAGRGTRMNSPLPKVLHPVAGVPMIIRVLKACKSVGTADIRVVVGYGQNLVRSIVEPFGAQCFQQVEQLGTADAVKAAKVETLEGTVMILNGDHPLIKPEDLTGFLTEFRDSKADIAVVTATLKNPGEFGRIVRYHGELHSIVEAKDASSETLKIREVNTGIYLAKAEALIDLLPKIKNMNSKKEFYLTDIIGIGKSEGYVIKTLKGHSRVSRGVNNQLELASASKTIFNRKIKSLLEAGVVVLDPSNTYIEDTVQIDQATVIYPGAYVRGNSKIGKYSVLEPNCFIIDCEIGDSVQIKAGSYLEKSIVRNKATVGPYARLRPETILHEEAHIGNFVELKKVNFGKGSKAGHLSYLGDAEIGENVNIGCGTITCNYAVDRKKYKTKIGNDVFVGSDSQFVAPIEVGDGAIIASGSTITQDVPANALAIGRTKQTNKENYASKLSPKES